MNVLGVEGDCLQHSQRLRENLVSDAVSGHGNYCVFRHDCSLELNSTAEAQRKTCHSAVLTTMISANFPRPGADEYQQFASPSIPTAFLSANTRKDFVFASV